MIIKMVCQDCGEEAPIDKKQSNENWTVYKNKCDKCGVKTVPVIVG